MKILIYLTTIILTYILAFYLSISFINIGSYGQAFLVVIAANLTGIIITYFYYSLDKPHCDYYYDDEAD